MEIWKDITDYNDYQISNHGNVKVKKNNASRKERILKPLSHPRGYFRVALYKNNKSKFFFIHRLVAIHFIENPNNKPDVNHIDGNKSNNTFTNLEWVTYKENIEHSVKNRISSCGIRNGRAKLTDLTVEEIRNDNSLTQRQLAKKYQVTQGTISRIKTNKGWK